MTHKTHIHIEDIDEPRFNSQLDLRSIRADDKHSE